MRQEVERGRPKSDDNDVDIGVLCGDSISNSAAVIA